jgi:hypothetical protein
VGTRKDGVNTAAEVPDTVDVLIGAHHADEKGGVVHDQCDRAAVRTRKVAVPLHHSAGSRLGAVPNGVQTNVGEQIERQMLGSLRAREDPREVDLDPSDSLYPRV